MTRFLQMLIYELKTVDGNRGSATKLINHEVKKLRAERQDFTLEECDRMIRHKVMLSVFFKYNIMRIR